jgi:hypothetical protein
MSCQSFANLLAACKHALALYTTRQACSDTDHILTAHRRQNKSGLAAKTANL